jgi:hypothetical protein
VDCVTDDEVLRWYECQRKQRRFTTFTEANDHAWEIERGQTKNFHAVHAYECWHCNGFHIGRAQLGRRRGLGRRLEHARHYEATHADEVRMSAAWEQPPDPYDGADVAFAWAQIHGSKPPTPVTNRGGYDPAGPCTARPGAGEIPQ